MPEVPARLWSLVTRAWRGLGKYTLDSFEVLVVGGVVVVVVVFVVVSMSTNNEGPSVDDWKVNPACTRHHGVDKVNMDGSTPMGVVCRDGHFVRNPYA